MDRQFFKSRKAAAKEAATMRGWDTKIVALSDMEGKSRWVIECDRRLYLRNDGFVR